MEAAWERQAPAWLRGKKTKTARLAPGLPRIVVTVLLLFLVLPLHAADDRGMAVEAMRTEKRVALVIGNAAYKSSPLKNPVNDANAVADALGQCGFDVIHVTDCSRRGMLEAVQTFGDRIRGGGVGLFYYAGHGVQLDGRNYLVPVDVNPRDATDVELDCLDAQRVLGKMEDADNRLNIVILDACRDNPFRSVSRSMGRGLARMEARGTIVCYATGPGQVAADGDAEHGVFTEAFLHHLPTPGLEIGRLMRLVTRDVQQANDRQCPWVSSSLMGDFYFVFDGAPAVYPPAIVTPPPPVQPLKPPPLANGPVRGRDWTVPEVGMEFVWIEALKCWAGKYEVTNGEYRKKEPKHDSKEYKGHSLNGDRQPVVYVTFDDAKAYAAWLTERERRAGRLLPGAAYRLPTEKEWETFASCGDNRKYPWGNEWPPKYGNYSSLEAKKSVGFKSPIRDYRDGAAVTCPVERSGKNDWGLNGVGGNVWECTQSNDVGAGAFGAWRGASWARGILVKDILCVNGRPDLNGATNRDNDYGFRLLLSPAAN